MRVPVIELRNTALLVAYGLLESCAEADSMLKWADILDKSG